MKSATYGILLMLVSCSIEKRLSNSIAKVERYKKALGVQPCIETTLTPTWAPPIWEDRMLRPDINFDTTTFIIRAQAFIPYKFGSTDTLGLAKIIYTNPK